MGEVCGAHVTEEKCYHVLVRIIEGDYLEDLAVDGWLIFKYTVKEHVGSLCICFIGLRVQTRDGLL